MNIHTINKIHPYYGSINGDKETTGNIHMLYQVTHLNTYQDALKRTDIIQKVKRDIIIESSTSVIPDELIDHTQNSLTLYFTTN